MLLIPEAAALLRTSTDTVRRLIRDRELAAKKIRGQWRIPRAAVERLLAPSNGKRATKRTSSTSSKATSSKATTKRTTRKG